MMKTTTKQNPSPNSDLCNHSLHHINVRIINPVDTFLVKLRTSSIVVMFGCPVSFGGRTQNTKGSKSAIICGHLKIAVWFTSTVKFCGQPSFIYGFDGQRSVLLQKYCIASSLTTSLLLILTHYIHNVCKIDAPQLITANASVITRV